MYKSNSVRYLLLFVVAVLLAALLGGCSGLGNQAKSEIKLEKILPADLAAAGGVTRLDADNDGDQEWLVFYRYEPDKRPIIAAVYRPVNLGDRLEPPTLKPWVLTVPPQKYLCQYKCQVRMDNVLTQGANGASNPDKELIFEDKLDDDIVRVSIFRWKAIGQTEEEQAAYSDFELLGHFDADEIKVEKDLVTCIYHNNDRSKLIVQAKYQPNYSAGSYYANDLQIIAPVESEITLSEWPTEISDTLYPEKLVLAFYKNYLDKELLQSYASESAWEQVIQNCPPGVCGCYAKRENVERVMVKRMAYETDIEQPQGEGGPERCQVVTQVMCVNKGGQYERPATVTWTIEKLPGETWKLINVQAGGQEYLDAAAGWSQ